MNDSRMSKRVAEEIQSVVEDFERSIEFQANRCESPIEQLLFIHLFDLHEDTYKSLLQMDADSFTVLEPQKTIRINNNVYRLDFYIECFVYGKLYKFVIECDGHNFHEKTKEQAKKDKKRDRNLTSDGFVVIRFTGSEIWNDPIGCVLDIRKTINKITGIDDFFKKLVEKDLWGVEGE